MRELDLKVEQIHEYRIRDKIGEKLDIIYNMASTDEDKCKVYHTLFSVFESDDEEYDDDPQGEMIGKLKDSLLYLRCEEIRQAREEQANMEQIAFRYFPFLLLLLVSYNPIFTYSKYLNSCWPGL